MNLINQLFIRLYRWACQRLYDECAWSYDWVSWLVSLGRWARWRRFALAHVTGREVLEIGFGTGELLLELAESDLNVVGLELSPAMHDVVQRKVQKQGVKVGAIQARAQAIPAADETFSTIISTFPAPYIMDAATLSECARLLKAPTREGSGGRLVVVGLWVDVGSAWLRYIVPLFYGQPDAIFLDAFVQQLEAAGFAVQCKEEQDGIAQVGIIIADRVI